MITDAEFEYLQHACEIADAKLEVAEDFAWPLSLFVGATVQLQFDLWPLTAAVALAAWKLSKLTHERGHEQAWARYQAARHGVQAQSASISDE